MAEHIYVRDLNLKGEGIGQTDSGEIRFVPDLLPGEESIVESISGQKHGARLLERLNLSPARIAPLCPHFGQCGGCQLQHLHPDQQAAWKSRRLQEALHRVGKLPLSSLNETRQPIRTAPVDVIWAYRSKVQVAFFEESGHIHWGYRSCSGRSLISLQRCLLHPEPIDTLLNTLASWWQIRPASLRTCHLHQAMVRLSHSTNQLLLSLYISGSVQEPQCKPIPLTQITATAPLQHALLPLQECLQSALQPLGIELHGHQVYPLANVPRHSCSSSDCPFSAISISGEDRITEELAGVRYLLSAQSFFQIHPLQTEQIIQLLQSFIEQFHASTVLDLYCGIGTFSLPLTQQGAHVHGIEIVPIAIDRARENAVLNHLADRVQFHCAPAERLTPRLLKQGLRPDCILLDPPRRGCARSLLDTIIQVSPPMLLYVSCHPETLARDLQHLCANGYRLQSWTPIDMFPWTTHVECVCLMTRVR